MPADRTRRRRALALVVVAGSIAACAGPRHVTLPPPPPIGALPAQLAGYAVRSENVTADLRRAGRQSYVTAVRLWSLRQGTYLRATLEIARFAADAPVASPKFQATVATNIATSQPVVRRVGTQAVYVTVGSREIFYVWFRGRDLLVLTVPASTARPRALLRTVLAQAVS